MRRLRAFISQPMVGLVIVVALTYVLVQPYLNVKDHPDWKIAGAALIFVVFQAYVMMRPPRIFYAEYLYIPLNGISMQKWFYSGAHREMVAEYWEVLQASADGVLYRK